MNFINSLRNIAYLFPVFGYYLVESIVIAIFTTVVWKFILGPLFNFPINYLQWISIIWISKIIFFNVFNLISGIFAMTQSNTDNNENM